MGTPIIPTGAPSGWDITLSKFKSGDVVVIRECLTTPDAWCGRLATVVNAHPRVEGKKQGNRFYTVKFMFYDTTWGNAEVMQKEMVRFNEPSITGR